tara:strand:- start:2114 stop:3202 length:1089 start_codon:yes stop_codon:yes gene_type:complete
MKNDFLASIMKVQSASYKTHRMAKFITKTLQKDGLGYSKDKYGNIYVEKGNADLYPTMVCHIDTVHDMNDNVRIVQTGDKMFSIDSSNCHRIGIGGDDKVGIYITLSCLRKFDNFKAVFYLDEEVGCVGSSQSDFNFFDNSTIVLECDRKGYGDFVTNISGTILSDDTLIDDIQVILDNYKYVTTNGGLTDVLEIAENTNIQVANISCGYYEPHTDNEYIVLSEVEKVRRMCIEIFTQTKDKQYTIDKDKRTVYYGYDHSNYGMYGGFNSLGYGDKYSQSVLKTIKPSDNSGMGSAIIDPEPNEDGYYKTDSKCSECDNPNMMYDEYEDALWCMNCGEYVSSYELELRQEDINFNTLDNDKA